MGETFIRTFAWGAAPQTQVSAIEPLVVEVAADAAVDTGVLRHSARLLRVRPEVSVDDVT